MEHFSFGLSTFTQKSHQYTIETSPIELCSFSKYILNSIQISEESNSTQVISWHFGSVCH